MLESADRAWVKREIDERFKALAPPDLTWMDDLLDASKDNLGDSERTYFRLQLRAMLPGRPQPHSGVK